jgi:hypothetical protein
MGANVTTVNQLDGSDGRQYRGEDCGLCVGLGLAVDTGLPRDESIRDMEVWYAAHGDTPVDGTGCEINAAWLRQEGLDAVSFNGDLSVVDSFLAKGWRVGFAIYSNGAGYPYSGPGYHTGHFIEIAYDNGDGTYRVMQPVGGYATNYSRDLIAAHSQDCGYVVRHDYRQNGITTVVGNNSGGVPMTFDPNKLRRGVNGLVRYVSGLPPATGADLDWEDTHALSLGSGEEEFYIEGLVAGTDAAEDQQIHRGLTVLHTLARGQVPPELHDAIKAIAKEA